MISLKNIIAKSFAYLIVLNIKRSYSRAPKIQDKTLKTLIKKGKKQGLELSTLLTKSIALRIMRKMSLLGIMKELRNILMK